MPLKKRTQRSSQRIIRPPVIPPKDETPWCDESSDIDPSYIPEPIDSGESLSTTVTTSEYSEAEITSESDSD